MAEYGPLLRMPFRPTLVKYAAEMSGEGGKKAHLEAGAVPQRVPGAPIPSVVTLSSGDPGAGELVRNAVGFCCRLRGGGARALTAALPPIMQPGSGLD